MLSIFGSIAKTIPRGAEFAHAVIDEEGKTLYVNQEFADLAQLITGKKIHLKWTIGKNIKDVFGRQTRDTIVGTFMEQKEKRSFSGNFMIMDQLYQVIVEEVRENNNAYYEFFYFPISERRKSSKERIFQHITYELATQKGFADVDWILTASDSHCKQLITCLINHEHTTTPNQYCPYKKHCKFNPQQGLMQLDRRTYYRAKVYLKGELYLCALNDRPVPPQVSMKKILCQAQDLSIGGIRLALNDICLPIGCVVKMVFDEFTCEGTVVWTAREGDEWQTGIKFSDLEPEQHYNIIRVLTKSRIVN